MNPPSHREDNILPRLNLCKPTDDDSRRSHDHDYSRTTTWQKRKRLRSTGHGHQRQQQNPLPQTLMMLAAATLFCSWPLLVLGSTSASTVTRSVLQVGHQTPNPSHRARTRRDETEHSGGAYGRGIGFFVGEPCHDQCNAILFHIYCNKTSNRCECLSDYPVNIDSRLCVKALRLGEFCEYRESCKHYDTNSWCDDDELRCRCEDAYYPKLTDGGMKCVRGNEIHSRRAVYSIVENSHFITIASAGAGLVAFAALICAALRYFTKGRFIDVDGRPHYRRSPGGISGANVDGPSPAVITGLDQAAPSIFSTRRPESIRSVSNEFLPPSRRASYTMLAPPSNFASRRPSSSVASHSSYSSFRSQSSFRNYRSAYGFTLRQPPASPTRTPSPHLHPPIPRHHHHPLDVSHQTVYVPNHCPPESPDKTQKQLHHHHHHHQQQQETSLVERLAMTPGPRTPLQDNCFVHSSLGVNNPGA